MCAITSVFRILSVFYWIISSKHRVRYAYHRSPWNIPWTSVYIFEFHCLQTQDLFICFDWFPFIFRALTQGCWMADALSGFPETLIPLVSTEFHRVSWSFLKESEVPSLALFLSILLLLSLSHVHFSSVTVNNLSNTDTYDKNISSKQWQTPHSSHWKRLLFFTLTIWIERNSENGHQWEVASSKVLKLCGSIYVFWACIHLYSSQQKSWYQLLVLLTNIVSQILWGKAIVNICNVK